MRNLALAGMLLVVLAGCQQPVASEDVSQRELFAPVSMRLHPIFTQVKSWSGGKTPDGIEAVLEFDDRFGDSTKAAGAVIFELYDFRRGFADYRGERLANPWAVSLDSAAQQEAHWRREISAYSFLLAYPTIRADRNYVLTASFEPLEGPRLFARPMIIQGQTKKKTEAPPVLIEPTAPDPTTNPAD
jgi:hypothetical protein